MRVLLLSFLLFLSPLTTLAQGAAPAPSYGISFWGPLKYQEGFAHFDYVNPDAPKGGAVKLAAPGTFDSLNPFIVKGDKAPYIGALFESLMVGSLDEPESMYGLIAKSVSVAPDRSYAEFVMRPEARFQDGSAITADDVVFSFNTLKKEGDPMYRINYALVRSAQKLGTYTVRFNFADTTKRELPLLVAAMPILSKAWYSTHDFTQTTLTPPLGSGPYKVSAIDAGRSITYTHLKNYWGAKLPVNVGQNNFDTIRYDMYRDETVSLEAFKAGQYDFREENIARNWATGYDCPALRDGRFKMQTVPNFIPQGMQGFVFNLRRAKFADRRVREAIGLTMDFEWMNKTLFYGAYKRENSYFINTPYAESGVPDAQEKALLEPFASQLPPQIFTEPFRMHTTDGSGQDRAGLLAADTLLNEAGWVIKDGARVNAKTGEKLAFEFLFQSPVYERAAAPLRRSLKQLGIDATIRIVDDAQYIKRLETFDYDIIMTVYNRSVFFPGTEQAQEWASSQADEQGSENYSGVKSPVLDALIAKITSVTSEEELLPIGHALDRVLLWEHYLIPNWYLGAFRIAYWDKFGRPAVAPKYSLGFNTWWIQQAH
jgi:microcin C transport system substrate-binding protein